MSQRMLTAMTAVLLFAGSMAAAEIKGTIAKIDTEKNTITVNTGGDADQAYPVAKDAEIYRQGKGRQNKPGPKEPIIGGLKGLTVGTEVTLMTIKSGSREIISSVRVDGTVKKKPKK